MYPTSDRLNRAVLGTHEIVSAAYIYSPSGELLTPDGIKLEAGFVRVDEGRGIRRRFTARTTDVSGLLTPKEAGDLTHPLSRNEFKIFRGVRFEDGTVELVPQGVFDMSEVNVSDSRDGYFLEIVGYDRARDVQRRRFTRNYVIPAGSNYTNAIQQMIVRQRPNTQFDFTPTGFVTPQLVFGGTGETGGGNAWDAGQKMAESIGMDLYFDVDGICILRPVPSFNTEFAHWHYHDTEDEPNQVLFVDKRMTEDETFNHVIVTGESTSNEAPIRGEAWDDDPNSPTYIYGPYGDIPTFHSSQFVRTVSQGNELAKAILDKNMGIEETVRIMALPHPGHGLGDIIHIKRDRSDVDDNYIIDQFTMPLESQQALSIGVRSKRK